MRIVAVIQARMGSSRLPGKVLLPICGIPLAILAAKRAQRNTYEVRIATTVDPLDDILVEMAKEADIPVVRGPVEDVLGRFVEATADLPDEALVVRLTADNVFPDADLIGMIVDEFLRKGTTSLVAATPESGLPYGLAAEVFRCGVLREAAQNAVTQYQREHVTPWIKSRYGHESIRVPDVPEGWAALRCTIDTLEDYVRVWRAFTRCGGDPVLIPWRALCEALAEITHVPVFRVPIREVMGAPHSVLVLGTAQLGLEYGWANTTRCPSEDEAALIVKKAIDHGVTHVDTARAYGESERRIGFVLESGYRNALTVVTKLDPLESLPPEASEHCVRTAVDASVFRSCRELRVPRLGVLLIHRAAHLDSHGGVIWKRLCELRNQGVIGALGVSVQSVDEAMRALVNPDVQYIQLPFNILDRRWLDPTFQEALRVRSDVVVHARSPLLQGLLAIDDPTMWPKVPGVDPRLILSKLRALAERLGRRDTVDLSLAYVRGQEWIHGVVLGVEKLEQLTDAAKLMCTPPLTLAECHLVEREIEGGPEALVNPALWGSKQ
jgi:spore coat polysaccharide biosynthesis protein SpsF